MKILLLGLGKTVTAASLPQSWPDAYVTKNFFGHEVITFGYADGVDIKCAPEDTFETIISRLPKGWMPDICICTHIDWLFIPPGIENAPFPIINITADWDYRLAIAKTCADIFDMTIVLGEDSRKSVESLGAKNVYPFHYFGVLKEHIHKDIDSIGKREFDISFTGSINDVSHLDRSKWLMRLCELSDKYNIYINYPGSSIEEYLEILRKSKLVFTFHRRGELQLRFTDAVAQGALVLDSGKETAKYFNDDEYAKFDDSDFEKVIDKFLNDENLRKETVKKCFNRVNREFESRYRFKELIDFIEEKLDIISKTKRQFKELPETEKLIRQAETYYYNFYETFIPRNISYLFKSAELLEKAAAIQESPKILTDLAVVKSSIAFKTSENFNKDKNLSDAIAILQRAIKRFPDYAMAYFNLAFIYFTINETRKAEKNFRLAIGKMSERAENLDPWCLYHFEHHKKPQDFKKILNDCLITISENKSQRGLLAANNLYISTCWYFIGKILLSEGKVYEAYECWQKSISKNCERGMILKELAELADILEDIEFAERTYKKALNLLPLNIELRIAYIKFLYRNKKYNECLQECKTTLKICKTIRAYRLCTKEIKNIILFLRRKTGETPSPFKSIDALKLGHLTNVIEFLTLAFTKNPKDIRLLLRGASLLINSSLYDDAIDILEKAEEKFSKEEKNHIKKTLVELYRYKIKKGRDDSTKYRRKFSRILTLPILSDNKRPFPKVSVLVRTYNRPNLLKECLESLVQQEFKDFEVVLVNDGGADVTEIAANYKNKLKISLVNHGTNLGRSAAWNSAIKIARGKHLAFLDDDDIFYPSHLNKLYDAIQKNNVKVAYSNCYCVKELLLNNEEKKVVKEIYKTNDFDPSLLLMKNYIPIITLMAEKEAVEDAGLFDESFDVHEDWDMLIRLALDNAFFHLNEATAEYRIRADNSNSRTAERERYLDTLMKLYDKYNYLVRNNPEILKVQQNNIKLLREEIEMRKKFVQKNSSPLAAFR